jgi:hypothetical protein
MNQQEIDEAVKLIAELDGKRTQGYWFFDDDYSGYIMTKDNGKDYVLLAEEDGLSEHDSNFIAAAPLMARTVAAQAKKIDEISRNAIYVTATDGEKI